MHPQSSLYPLVLISLPYSSVSLWMRAVSAFGEVSMTCQPSCTSLSFISFVFRIFAISALSFDWCAAGIFDGAMIAFHTSMLTPLAPTSVIEGISGDNGLRDDEVT